MNMNNNNNNNNKNMNNNMNNNNNMNEKYLYATEVPIIMGCGYGKYENDIIKIIERIKENKKQEIDKSYVKIGKYLENGIIDYLINEKNLDIINQQKKVQVNFNNIKISGKIDATTKNNTIVEIKVSQFENWEYYKIQTHIYMKALNTDKAIVAILKNGDIKTYNIEFNQDTFNLIKEKVTHFWEHFILNENRDTIMKPKTFSIEDAYEQNIEDAINRIINIKKQINQIENQELKDLKKEEKLLKNIIINKLDVGEYQFNNKKIIITETIRNVIDKNKISQEHYTTKTYKNIKIKDIT